MPRPAASDSEEELQPSKKQGTTKKKVEGTPVNDVNDEDSEDGSDEEFEIEAILDARQGVFGPVCTSVYLNSTRPDACCIDCLYSIPDIRLAWDIS